MKSLKIIVGENLTALRKEKKMTQLEIAEMFNYSDKAVSKWENGETLPDIETLHNLATFYGVTLDYLTQEDNVDKKKYKLKKTNILFIICLLVAIVWFLGTIIYVGCISMPQLDSIKNQIWIVFVACVPVSCIVLYLCNHKWGKPYLTFYITSVFIWSLITTIYLAINFFPEYGNKFWSLYLLGVPAQIIICLWSGVKKEYNPLLPIINKYKENRRKNKNKKEKAKENEIKSLPEEEVK